MKLYYSPGACSMAVDIALHEAGTAFEMEKVDLAARKTAAGEDYTRINPKGYVPALRLDNCQLLTEVAVILQYVADQKPDSGLAPKAGTMERYRLMEWLNFVSSEIHKQFSPLWNPKTPEETRQMQKDRLAGRFDWLSKELDGKPFLMDGQFTVADAYLFTVLNWTHILKIDLGRWPKLKDYMARVAARPKVQETMKAEGLVK